ncbi:hypothetical protein CMV_014856 [Castanea mollissima]|uniref:Uncharacterized protein n=1 Tax=Castanea mollissima TaxID=60419 RepID=A0A8J4VGM7_9ROSI|nr:hypothetical protein CMV_014856 [Castanea mollissima]
MVVFSQWPNQGSNVKLIEDVLKTSVKLTTNNGGIIEGERAKATRYFPAHQVDFLDMHYLSWLLIISTTVLLQALGAALVAVPSSNCYVLDNSSHILDFSGWVGQLFQYEGKDSDLVIRFCKDVESRSQKGYVDFGRFDKLNYFVTGSGIVDFVQDFFNGDLMN